MRYAARIKPISYLKANAAQVLAELADTNDAMIITQNGAARAVLQDIASYEATQQSLALLKLLALGNADIDAGRTRPARAVIDRLRAAR